MRLLCRLGFHSWYVDGSYLTTVDRCNFCPAVTDQFLAAQQDYERRLFTEIREAEPGLDFDILAGRVARRVANRLFNREEDPLARLKQ